MMAPGINHETLVGVTTAAGNLGCALVGSESAAPGVASSLVYAKLQGNGDARCPWGRSPITSNPSCNVAFGELPPGCALYKEWDASGAQIANVLAIGGYVTVDDVAHTDMDHGCNVTLSATFPGGVTITSTFSFDYNPYDSTSSFCTH
jgi:hypothetical protein